MGGIGGEGGSHPSVQPRPVPFNKPPLLSGFTGHPGQLHPAASRDIQELLWDGMRGESWPMPNTAKKCVLSTFASNYLILFLTKQQLFCIVTLRWKCNFGYASGFPNRRGEASRSPLSEATSARHPAGHALLVSAFWPQPQHARTRSPMRAIAHWAFLPPETVGDAAVDAGELMIFLFVIWSIRA